MSRPRRVSRLPVGVHRGAAFGDLDTYGRVDVGPHGTRWAARILPTFSPAPNHWLLIRTIGTKSNRDGIGTRIRLVTKDSVQYNAVGTGVGYASSFRRACSFWASAGRALVQELELFWPSGTHQVLKNVKADHMLTVREP